MMLESTKNQNNENKTGGKNAHNLNLNKSA